MTSKLSRRELLAWMLAGTGAAAASGSVLLNGDPNDAVGRGSGRSRPVDTTGTSTSSGTTPLRNASADSAPTPSTSDRMLVVVEMPGGNDSLSMAVPYGIGTYYDRRTQTAIAEGEVLRIDDQVGLHPNMVNLHRRGITLVEGLGSFEPDGSHFEMQARWWAGDSQAGPSQTGWIGRLADVLNSDSIPAAAVSVGSSAHPIVRSATGSTLSMPNADSVWALVGADPDDSFRQLYQDTLRAFADGTTLHATTLGATIDFAQAIVDLNSASDPEALGYDAGGLGKSLEFAAMMFDAGTGVRVVHVAMDGDFDTHEGHTWKYPDLARQIDVNLEAFHNDLDQRGLGDKVMVMTTSEFGRTFNENDSGGLDHGTAATAFLSGPGTGGRVGELPSFTQLDDNDDLVATVPFEAYLAGVVEGWLGVPADEIFPGATPLPLFT